MNDAEAGFFSCLAQAVSGLPDSNLPGRRRKAVFRRRFVFFIVLNGGHTARISLDSIHAPIIKLYAAGLFLHPDMPDLSVNSDRCGNDALIGRRRVYAGSIYRRIA